MELTPEEEARVKEIVAQYVTPEEIAVRLRSEGFQDLTITEKNGEMFIHGPDYKEPTA
jgi:hypothetical protein